MNIILKTCLTSAAMLGLIAYHTNTTAAIIDPEELSKENKIHALATVEMPVPPPTVAWHATPNLKTDIKSGALVGGIRVSQTSSGHICARTDADGVEGGTYVMRKTTGEIAAMTLEEVSLPPRILVPTTTYDTAGCTTGTDKNILLALKKYGNGMEAGSYNLDLYFAVWTE
ncbi:hypothetical protein OFK37_000013 [Salmonella enterica]|nr:hypothetical protein [Salmonella enterica]EJX4072454.1 hypothetical protein [Salmonella enterica]EJX4077292.1 hypothetical protein [Salmonella enterica]EJX4082131.1 hypothetical protein [Salmonella enterica]EJX4086962.1 hypothetical protein [Salmonella enterica]